MRARLTISLLLSLAVGISAYPQNNRSAVAITGVDTAACTPADPCRMFSAAIAKTNSGGEVIALQSGGYGAFTIDRPISIIAPLGIHAGIATSSGNAVTVNAGTFAQVVIRGLSLNGLGTASSGIAIGSALETSIENCRIERFADNGVISGLNFTMSDTTVSSCRSGIWVDNAGGPVKANLQRVVVRDTSGSGFPYAAIKAFRNAVVTVKKSASYGSAFVGFLADSGGQMTIDGSVSTRAAYAAYAVTNAGSVLRLSDSMATDSFIGVYNFQATYETYGNNKIRGNDNDLIGTPTPVTPN